MMGISFNKCIHPRIQSYPTRQCFKFQHIKHVGLIALLHVISTKRKIFWAWDLYISNRSIKNLFYYFFLFMDHIKRTKTKKIIFIIKLQGQKKIYGLLPTSDMHVG